MWKHFFFALSCVATAWGLAPSQVVVVYNADSPLSEKTARRYCELRGIDVSQMVALREVKSGDISRADFERKVKSPLLYAASGKDWRYPGQPVGGKEMFAMVLMPDIPLRVKESPAVQEERKKLREAIKRGEKQGKVPWTPEEAAAVDSELMLLGAQYPLRSALHNPFYKQDAAATAAHPPVMAVCRIDGPDEATIARMIEDPVRVEREGLWGWTVIDRGGPYAAGETMFKAAASSAQQHHQPLFYETSKKTLAASFPLMPQTAVYFGWYEHRANGPFSPQADAAFRFAPGAVAGHLHSFSCENCKDAKQWAPALLQRGAAVTMGNVYEPFLTGCHDFGVFFDRLLKGYCVADAMLMATPLLSWQEVTFGDPLYRPFAAPKRGVRPNADPFAEWQEMSSRAAAVPEAMESAVRAKLGKPEGGFFAEAFAQLCAEKKKYTKAADYFRMASNAARTPADKLRPRLMQITCLALAKDHGTAKQLMLQTLEETAESPHRAAVEATAAAVIPKEWAAMKKAADEQKKAAENQAQHSAPAS